MNNMAFFEFNNKKIFYLDEGQGEPLIILNGIMISHHQLSVGDVILHCLMP